MSNYLEKAKLGWAKNWLGEAKVNYVGGEWGAPPSSAFLDSVNPASDQVLAQIVDSGEQAVDRAVASARKAFESGVWSRVSRKERAQFLRRICQVVKTHHEELATLEALDNGMLFREAYFDNIPDCGDIFEYYAGWIDKLYGETVPVDPGFLNYTQREPVGVCGLIVPWNFPLLLATWKLAPALAMGNTVVIKPSSATPLSLVRFFEILHEEVGLPPGVVNLVLGSGKTGSWLANHRGG